jgi:hypothetical protein
MPVPVGLAHVLPPAGGATPSPPATNAAMTFTGQTSTATSSQSSSSVDPRVLWMQNCVSKLLSNEFNTTEVNVFFGELNEALVRLLGDVDAFKYLFLWRTAEPIEARHEDEDFVETRKLAKYFALDVDRVSRNRSPIDLHVFYFQRKKAGYIPPVLDDQYNGPHGTKYAQFIKFAILNQVCITFLFHNSDFS